MHQIAYITDIHLDEKFTLDEGVDARKNWLIILEDVKSRGISQIIFGGDIGTPESNSWFFNSLKEFDLSITLGNHDSFEEAVKYFNPGLPEGQKALYYAMESEFLKLIFLDSSTGRIDDAQFQWFKRSLDTSKPIILFIHHPILETGTTPQREFPWESPQQLKEELLKISNPLTIFCGHLHLMSEVTESNMTQFVTPSASVQIKPHSEKTEIEGVNFGYRIITTDGEKISNEIIWLEN